MAGAAGPCLEMIKLFQVEMEHYQKIEGETLALDGKANKLAQMVKQNLPAAFQGLIVIPIFVGYDLRLQQGRIFKYDVTGGRGGCRCWHQWPAPHTGDLSCRKNGHVSWCDGCL